MDRRLDGPPDGGRKIPRKGLQGRSGAECGRQLLRLHRLRPRPVRVRVHRQPDSVDHRQRLRLQAAEGAAAGRHAPADGLREDLPGARHGHRGGARAAGQVRPAPAGGNRQAQARPVGPQLRARRLRGAEGRARFHQGRREHQLPALHALAGTLPLLHGGGQQGAGRDGRDQGHLSQRHRRDDGRHVRAGRIRTRPRLGHHHDRPRHRLDGHPVDGQMGPPQQHDPAPAPRGALHLHAAEGARRVLPRHCQMGAAGGGGPYPCRHRGRQARGRSGNDARILRYLPRRVHAAQPCQRRLLRPALGIVEQDDARRLGRHSRRPDAPASGSPGRGCRAAVRRRHDRPSYGIAAGPRPIAWRWRR